MVKEASIERLLKKRDQNLLKPFIDSAIELQEEGVKGITGACGFMALFPERGFRGCGGAGIPFQPASNPVYLQDAPTRPKDRDHHGRFSSLTTGSFCGGRHQPGYPAGDFGNGKTERVQGGRAGRKGNSGFRQIEKEVVGVARKMVREHPEVGALLAGMQRPSALCPRDPEGNPAARLRFLHDDPLCAYGPGEERILRFHVGEESGCSSKS